MKLSTWLRKQGFDITSEINEDDEHELWVNEEEDSAEPVVILTEVVQKDGSSVWKIGNIYSHLTHGDIVSEDTIRQAVKTNNFVKEWA